jgi:hypothetical protein
VTRQATNEKAAKGRFFVNDGMKSLTIDAGQHKRPLEEFF